MILGAPDAGSGNSEGVGRAAGAFVPEAVRQPEHQQGRRRRVESQLTQSVSVQVQGGGLQLVLQLTNHGIGGGPGDGGQDERGGRGQQSPLRDTRQNLASPASAGQPAATHHLTSRLGKTLSCLFPKAPPYMVKSSKLIWRTREKLSAPGHSTGSESIHASAATAFKQTKNGGLRPCPEGRAPRFWAPCSEPFAGRR